MTDRSPGLDLVRLVAVVEGLKGILVVAAGFGLLALIDVNVQAVAEQMVAHLHLDAAKKIPRIFLNYITELNDTKLAVLAGLALAYAIGRLVEAYGLWFERTWAEWVAVVTAAIYIPFELFELARGNATAATVALLVNLLVVGIMVRALWGSHRRRALR